jgi:hypothetical protein
MPLGSLSEKYYSTKDGRGVLIREAKEDDAEAIIEVSNAVIEEGAYSPSDRFPHDEKWVRDRIRKYRGRALD